MTAYVAWTGLLCAVTGHPERAGLHALLVAALLLARRRCDALWAVALPLVLLSPLYVETGLLSDIAWGGRAFDAEVLAVENGLFGRSPALWMSEAVPSRWVSEALHMCYASFWVVVPLLPLDLHRRDRARERDACLLAIVATFLCCFLGFMLVPVNGPRGVFPPLDPHLHGPFFRLCHAVLEGGAAVRAAFPSGHVAVMIVCAACARRWHRPVSPVVTALAAGVTLCTVYGRFHYALDALAGAMFAWRVLAALEPCMDFTDDPDAGRENDGVMGAPARSDAPDATRGTH